MPMNIGCQNTASQIQGNDNAAALASAQDLTTKVKNPNTFFCLITPNIFYIISGKNWRQANNN
jgi:hypothetical protein